MKTKLVIVAVSLILGVMAAMGGAAYLTGARKQIDEGMRPVEVLVARENLSPGLSAAEISSRRLAETERIPQRYVASGAISSVSQAQGQVLAVPVAKGEQLATARFKYPSDAGLAFSTPNNRLAVTIPGDEMKAVAGLLKAGDKVVVVATFSKEIAGKDVTRILLPNVSVLAVDQRVGAEVEKTTSPAGSGDALASTSQTTDRRRELRSVTLAIAPRDVPKLVFAQEKGKIWLALLPAKHKPISRGAAETIKSVLK